MGGGSGQSLASEAHAGSWPGRRGWRICLRAELQAAPHGSIAAASVQAAVCRHPLLFTWGEISGLHFLSLRLRKTLYTRMNVIKPF